MFASRSAVSSGVLTQAHGLTAASRNTPASVASHGVTTLLFASGRGGSGTTMLAALFAVAAAGDGHRVLFIDGDDMFGPASMLLGVRATATWQQLRAGNVGAQDVITPITQTLSVVAGGALQGTDAIVVTAAERRACMRRLAGVADRFDLIVIDCGARLDALAASITPHAAERLVAVTGSADPVTLATTYALAKAARLRHASLPVDVLVNRQEESEARRSFDALDAGARQFLGTTFGLAGIVPNDKTLDAALRAGMPFWDAAAGSPAAIAAHDAVTRMMSNAVLPLSRSGF